MLTDDELKWLILDLLKEPSERDGQRLIGPSEIGNPCEHCIANRLVGTGKGSSKYWLGARIGTAIHEALERQINRHIEKASGKFSALRNALVEQSFELTTIDGYGTIRLKPDLVLVEHNHLVDHKTTSKKKLMGYKLDGVPQQYVIQQNLYAYGLNKAGIKIDRISLNFINREGTSDVDINIFSFDYSEQVALDAIARLDSIWKQLQGGKTPDDFESDPSCYYCSRVIGRI